MAHTAAMPAGGSATPGVAAAGSKRRWRGRARDKQGEAFWGYAFIAPTAIGLAIFYLWPTLRTLYLSFTESGPFGGVEWVGLENYRQMWHDPDVRAAIRNTLVYTVIMLLGIPIAIAIAAMLNQKGLRLVGFYRVLYFLPVVTMQAAVALVWRAIYHGDYGILNRALSVFGVDGTSWLTNSSTALYAVAIVGIWMNLGIQIVILLAGLQGIPTEIYEAADIDGASRIQQFFKITVPLLSPSIFFVTVLSVINSMQIFDLVFMMMASGRQPSPALPQARSIVYLFYQEGFIANHRGYGAGIAMTLLAIVLIATLIQFRLQKRWVHYA